MVDKVDKSTPSPDAPDTTTTKKADTTIAADPENVVAKDQKKDPDSGLPADTGAPDPDPRPNAPATPGSGALVSNTPGSVTTGGEQLIAANPEGGTLEVTASNLPGAGGEVPISQGAPQPDQAEASYSMAGADVPDSAPDGIKQLAAIAAHIQDGVEDAHSLFSTQGGNYKFTVGGLRSIMKGASKKSK